MVVDDRVGGTTIVQYCLVEVLDILWGERVELDGRRRKVGNYPGFHHNGVALVGGE